jgi:GT2 family glycosyltransferase
VNRPAATAQIEADGVEEAGDGCERSLEDTPLSSGITAVICTYQRPHRVVRTLDSLLAQERAADAVLVIDASTDDRTSDALREWREGSPARNRVRYWHVTAPHRGLTRQRNFALDRVTTDLVAFFDDDVVLGPNCLAELERVHRAGRDVIGVGCFAGPAISAPRPLWRLRRWLGIIPSLAPGRYFRSGISTPWEFDLRREPVVEGDWLPGWGMTWKTVVARRIRFHSGFAGYAQGEDLDFSLRMREHGRLLMARDADLRHVPDAAGRPDPFRQGYMEIYNRFEIHRRGLQHRRAGDVLWFVYAWGVDSLLLARHLVRPSRSLPTLRQLAGRFHAARCLLSGR